MRAWHHQLAHLNIHKDWSRNVSWKNVKFQNVITPLFLIRFSSFLHQSVGKFLFFLWIYGNSGLDFPFKLHVMLQFRFWICFIFTASTHWCDNNHCDFLLQISHKFYTFIYLLVLEWNFSPVLELFYLFWISKIKRKGGGGEYKNFAQMKYKCTMELNLPIFKWKH